MKGILVMLTLGTDAIREGFQGIWGKRGTSTDGESGSRRKVKTIDIVLLVLGVIYLVGGLWNLVSHVVGRTDSEPTTARSSALVDEQTKGSETEH